MRRTSTNHPTPPPVPPRLHTGFHGPWLYVSHHFQNTSFRHFELLDHSAASSASPSLGQAPFVFDHSSSNLVSQLRREPTRRLDSFFDVLQKATRQLLSSHKSIGGSYNQLTTNHVTVTTPTIGIVLKFRGPDLWYMGQAL